MGDCKTIITLFNSVVRGMMLNGAEVCGWERLKKIKRMQVKYLQWTVGLNRNTPTYRRKEIRFEEKIKKMERRERHGKTRVRWKKRKTNFTKEVYQSE